MRIPETYEEFLKTPKPILKQIVMSNLTLAQATQMVKYLNQLELDKKLITKNKTNFPKLPL
jgi:hypothetical protein